MAELRKYGEATTLVFPLIDAGAQDFEATPVTFAAGDTKIIKDEGAAANTTNNPAHEGNGIYSLALTATEMQAARIVITIVDATATKEWEDQAIIIDTYGNPSAQHALDLDDAQPDVNVEAISGDSTAADNLENLIESLVVRAATAQAGGPLGITLDASASATDDFYNHAFVAIRAGTGVGQVRQITDYNGTTKVATVSEAWRTQPDSSSEFVILGEALQGVSVNFWRGSQPNALSSGRVDASVGAMATDVLAAAALATDAAQEIADEIFRMTTATIEAAGGGVPDDRTLYGVIAALMHKHERDAGDNNIVLYQSDDSTVLVTIPITKSAILEPIQSIDPP